MPDHIRQKLASVDAETAKQIGINHPREIYHAARETFGGVYFMPPLNKHEVVREIMVG